MKRILLFACVALLAWACSKDEDYDTPPLILEDENWWDGFWNGILEVSSDTIGLRLYGYGTAYTKDDTLLYAFGSKLGKVWSGFYTEIKSDDTLHTTISVNEEFVYVGSEDFIDSLEFEVGYGETSEVVFTSEIPYPVSCYFFNEEEFAIYKYGDYNNYATIFVNGDDVVYKPLGIGRLWYDGYYWGRTWNGNVSTVFDLNGDIVFTQDESFEYGYLGDSDKMLPVSLYDCICFTLGSWDDYITVKRINTLDCTEKWGHELFIGKTINGNLPKITYSRLLEGGYLHIEATAVNYDGSKETKSFKIDIETGEMEE